MYKLVSDLILLNCFYFLKFTEIIHADRLFEFTRTQLHVQWKYSRLVVEKCTIVANSVVISCHVYTFRCSNSKLMCYKNRVKLFGYFSVHVHCFDRYGCRPKSKWCLCSSHKPQKRKCPVICSVWIFNRVSCHFICNRHQIVEMVHLPGNSTQVMVFLNKNRALVDKVLKEQQVGIHLKVNLFKSHTLPMHTDFGQLELIYQLHHQSQKLFNVPSNIFALTHQPNHNHNNSFEYAWIRWKSFRLDFECPIVGETC